MEAACYPSAVVEAAQAHADVHRAHSPPSPLPLASRPTSSATESVESRSNASAEPSTAVTSSASATGPQVPPKAAGRRKSRDGPPSASARFAWQELHKACHCGNERQVERLLRLGTDKFAQDDEGRTAVHRAAEAGHSTVLQMLLDAGASHQVEDNEGCLPLHPAAEHGHARVVEVLLRAKCDPQARNRAGFTPLHLAALSNHAQVIKVYGMLKFPLDSQQWEFRGGFTPLHMAVLRGHSEATHELLRSGAYVRARADRGVTPLHVAAEADQAHLITPLVDAHGDISARLANGRTTPLHAAAEAGSCGALEVLMRLGASPTARNADSSGWSALHTAAWHGHVDALTLLLDTGLDPNAVDHYGFTPLHLAAEHNKVAAIDTLLREGVHPEAPRADGWTPLHSAALHGAADAARSLIHSGADVHARTKGLWGLFARSPMDVAGRHSGCDPERRKHVEDVLAQAGAVRSNVPMYGNEDGLVRGLWGSTSALLAAGWDRAISLIGVPRHKVLEGPVAMEVELNQLSPRVSDEGDGPDAHAESEGSAMK